MPKDPLDRSKHRRDRRSHPLNIDTADGNYVYVVASDGVIWVLTDYPHAHPRVLGSAHPAEYAGDLVIRDGRIAELTNLSGTFQFEDAAGLRQVAETIRNLGFEIEVSAIRFFPSDGSRPRILE
jgi:hypothetical protein